MRFNNTLFWIAWSISAVVSMLYFGWRWNEKKKRGPLFPTSPGEPILYQENFASGRSRKNLITRIGGASHCLKLIVTQNELWITSFFPFTLFTDFYDLEHRILKKNIVAIREESVLIFRRLIVEYRRENGQNSEIELVPKHFDRFKQAMEEIAIST